MKALNKFNFALRSISLTIICFLFFSIQAFATNYMDSDLSNNAGTNKNWQNSYWFFVCVAFLVGVSIIGYHRKFIKINRNYNPKKPL